MLIEKLVTGVDKVKNLKMQVTILKKAVAHGAEVQKEYALKVYISEPQCFKGMWDEKEIGNFLWHRALSKGATAQGQGRESPNHFHIPNQQCDAMVASAVRGGQAGPLQVEDSGGFRAQTQGIVLPQARSVSYDETILKAQAYQDAQRVRQGVFRANVGDHLHGQ